MLSKEKFIEYLDEICRDSDLQDNINTLTRGYDLLDLNITIQEGLALRLLAECMGDEGEWIKYWFYELDQGKKDYLVTDKDGKPIPLTTKEDLYNMLRSEQRWKRKPQLKYF